MENSIQGDNELKELTNQLRDKIEAVNGEQIDRATIQFANRFCIQCGTGITSKRKDKRFCSNICRAKYSLAHRNKNLGNTSDHMTKTEDVIPHYKFLYQQQLDRYKDLQSEYNKLKEESTLQISDLTNEISQRKGGLSGVLQSEAGQNLLTLFGPAIARVAEKFADGIQGDSRSKSFNEWLTQQPDQIKELVFFIAQGLAQLNDDKREEVIRKITDALKPAEEKQQPKEDKKKPLGMYSID